MTKVVVTGAAGFIGSHVADELEKRGHDIVRSDILGSARSNDGWRLADLTHFDELIELTRGASVVCHIGGIGDVYQATRDPALTMRVNASGTANLLEASTQNSVERFVYASTWEVYGPARYEPIDELHPCHPRHPYSISKLAGDLISQAYGENGALSTVVLRLGTAYGARMRPNGVIPVFVHRALSSQPIEIQGEGSQLRQFTHVADIAGAFVLAIGAKSPAPVFNIAGPEPICIRDLAKMVARRIPAELVTVPSRANDAPFAIVSSKRAETELGWRPQIPFSRGLAELMDSYVRESRVPAV